MQKTASQSMQVPRIEYLRVRNFRALGNIDVEDLTPMTVLLGPNGSGKSTLFDVFAFLAECFMTDLRRAWDRRGRARELKTRDAEGPIVIELGYRERPDFPRIGYHLEIDERGRDPVVLREWLRWKRMSWGGPFHFLDYREGKGRAVGGDEPGVEGGRQEIPLKRSDLLAVNALGQFQGHPRVAALRDFIMGWHVSYLSADSARGQPEAGPQERLTTSGDNLANVVQYLSEQHPERLDSIFETLRRRVPRIERVIAEEMTDGRLLLQIKDAPFDKPVHARFASDGTLKMLAYLVLLHDPDPPPFIGVEEPENFLHPRLLPELAEECRTACERTQLFVTTHSPFFLEALDADEARILWRDEQGHTQVQRASDIHGIRDFVKEGANLGQLWMEGFLGVGDPLTRQGAPARRSGGARP